MYLFSKLNDTNRVKKCARSSKLNKFEKQFALSLEPNYFMRIIKSKKLRLEFKPRIIEFELQVTHIFTRITLLISELHSHFFCRDASRYFSRLKGFDFLSLMGPPPLVRSFLIPWITPWFFNKNYLTVHEYIVKNQESQSIHCAQYDRYHQIPWQKQKIGCLKKSKYSWTLLLSINYWTPNYIYHFRLALS